MATFPALAFELDDAVRVLRESYGLTGEVSELPSYADRNFRVRTSRGDFVLKIARHDEEDAELDFQNAALEHLGRAKLPGPELIASVEGRRLEHVHDAAGQPVRARLVTWVEGAPLATIAPRSDALFGHFGSFLARLDHALAPFSHPAAGRELTWDLRRALLAREHLSLLDSQPARHDLAAAPLERFERDLAGTFDELPRQVIHNDANDHNVLVRDERVVAIIDYGDMVATARVCDPAIALTYLMLGTDDPYGPARAFLEGYLTDLPLTDNELEALAVLVPTRLAVSVLSSTRAKLDRPDDPYLDVTEPHAWALLERLAGVTSAEFLDRILPR